MTKLLFVIFFFFTATFSWADPFLSADPFIPQADPNLNPVSFLIKGIGANSITSQAYVQPSNGQIWLMYDLSTLPNGTYTVTAAAVNIFGGMSPDSAPFTFTKGVPGTPGNLTIRQTRPL